MNVPCTIQAPLSTSLHRTAHLAVPVSTYPCTLSAQHRHRLAARSALNSRSQDEFERRLSSFDQQLPAGYLRPSYGAAAAPPQQQCPPSTQQAVPGSQQLDSELLWAGYSDLSEQLHKMHTRHEVLTSHIQELQAKLQAMQSLPPASVWQAASFLLFFLGFINFMGLLANFHLGMFLPWAVKSQGSMMVRELLGVALPITNTVVVLIFCLQAIKAAWACLRW